MSRLMNSPMGWKSMKDIDDAFKHASKIDSAKQARAEQLARDKALEEAAYILRQRKRLFPKMAQEERGLEEEAAVVLRDGKRKTFQGREELEDREKKRHRSAKVKANTKLEIEKTKLDGDVLELFLDTPLSTTFSPGQKAQVISGQTLTKNPVEKSHAVAFAMPKKCPECSKRPCCLLWKGPDAYAKACSYQTCDHWFEYLMDAADQIDPHWEFDGGY
ncbi:MAG: hypothetical protein MMC33_001992 [Icmadophila ericetorum]|nr:hypothetical protein [Icmadophila ericetorum]